MTTLGQVRRWSPPGVEAAATVVHRERATLLGLQAELDAGARPQQWTGEGWFAASVEHARLSEALRRTAAQSAAVGRALDEAADSLTRVHTLLVESDDLANRYGFFLGENNQVADMMTSTEGLSDGQLADRERMAAELADRITQIVRAATDTDADLAAVLTAAANDDIDDGSGQSLAGASVTGRTAGGLSGLEPPDDASPADNASWWDTLTPEQQDAYLDENPADLGNRDGLPATVRDEANRAQLGTARDEITADIARLQANLDHNTFGGLFSDDDARLTHARNRLADLDAIEATLERGDRQLLVLDNTGEMVRAAIASGDVDTADHVSVFTSGLDSSTRDSLAGYDNDQAALGREAREQLQAAGRGDETVATVTWMGYEPPQTGGFFDDARSDDEVTSRNAAEAGAPPLARFLNGIDASRAEDAHLTTLGHSYGSLTTGLALQEGTGVDDVVFYGSPGVGTSDVADLHVPEGHVYVAEAHQDPVADLAYFGHDPNQMDGVNALSADEGTAPDGTTRGGSEGHSEYVVEGTMSQYNMAAVLSGNAENTVEGDHFGLGDVIQWNPFR